MAPTVHADAMTHTPVAYQRHRSRKQSVPQRSCLDSAMDTPTAAKPSTHPAAAPADTTRTPRKLNFSAFDDLEDPTKPSDHSADFNNTAAVSLLGLSTPKTAQQNRKSRVTRNGPRGKNELFAGLCDFCHITLAPLWRTGPEEYPTLCNACGMRHYRYSSGKSHVDPFRPEALPGSRTLARAHCRASKTAAAAIESPASEAEISTQHIPAVLARKPRKRPAVANSAFNIRHVQGAAARGIMAVHKAAGKRIRVPSAKGAELLAMQAEASPGKRQRSRLATQTQQHQEQEQDHEQEMEGEEQEEVLCADAEVLVKSVDRSVKGTSNKLV